MSFRPKQKKPRRRVPDLPKPTERTVLCLETDDGPAYIIGLPGVGNVVLSGPRQFAAGRPISRRLSLPEGSTIYLIDHDANLKLLLGDQAPAGLAVPMPHGAPAAPSYAPPKRGRGRPPRAAPAAPAPVHPSFNEAPAFPRCRSCGSEKIMNTGEALHCNECGHDMPLKGK
jgi:hypothetical protein